MEDKQTSWERGDSSDPPFIQLQSDLEKLNTPDLEANIQLLINKIYQDPDLLNEIQRHDGEISGVISKLEQLGVSESKIQAFCESILQIKNLGIPEEPSTDSPVYLEFICDFDSVDWSGAMIARLNHAIGSRHPVITSRSILRGANLRADHPVTAERDQLFKQIQDDYDIYTNRSLLIFIPKKMTLEKLDLVPSQLGNTSLEEAWKQSDSQPDLEDLMSMFSDTPKKEKYIHIAGHGRVRNPAGLTTENYNNFLLFAKKQNCRGLLVSTCFGGGASSALHLPEERSPNPQKFQPKRVEKVSYPVIVNSIGDFPTFGMQEVQSGHTSNLFSKLVELLNSPGGSTVFRLREMLKESEKSDKKAVNLIQVYFPHSLDSPGGFRPVGEGGSSYPLTFTNYRKEQVSWNQIVITDQKFVEVSPLVVACPVIFKKGDPEILSLIPGQAQHLFTEIQLSESTPGNYLGELEYFYRQSHIGVSKVFFFSTLKSNDRELSQVFLDVKKETCGFRQEDQYYLWRLNPLSKPVSVSPFQYFLQLKMVVDRSRPKNEAVRSATGGQQSREEIDECLSSSTFWNDQLKTYEKFKDLPDNSIEELNLWIDNKNLSEPELVSLLTYLLTKNETLACKLYQGRKLAPDLRDEMGVPLILHAVNNQCNKFAKILISDGTNPNLQGPVRKYTALTIALMKNNLELVDFLLEQKKVDIHLKNHEDQPVFSAALYHLAHLKACAKKDPSLLHEKIKTKSFGTLSLLSLSIFSKSMESIVEFLLSSDIDANDQTGDFSPLTACIVSGKTEFLSSLLSHGANPLARDKGGHYPIIEAMKRSSLTVVQHLLDTSSEIETTQIDESQASIETIFIAAIESGEVEKIRLLLSRNPRIQKTLSTDEIEGLKRGIKRLLLFGHIDTINTLMLHIDPNCTEAIKAITEVVVKNSPEVVNQINSPPWDLTALLSEVIKTGNESLYRVCLEKGCDKLLNDNTLLNQTLSLAVQQIKHGKDAEKIVKDLVEKGASLNTRADENYLTLFTVIAQYGSLELITWCLDHDAKINSDNPSLKTTPLQAATLRTDRDSRAVLTLLVFRGADLSQRGFSNFHPLIGIIESKDLELVQLCFKQGARLPDDLIELAFITAFKAGVPEIVDELIQQNYTFSMAEWDENKTEELLYDILFKENNKLLEKALEFNPSARALNRAKEFISDLFD